MKDNFNKDIMEKIFLRNTFFFDGQNQKCAFYERHNGKCPYKERHDGQ